MFQTVVQNLKTIKIGSAIIEIGPDLDSLTNLGLASDIEFEENFALTVLKPDSGPEIPIGIDEHYATIKFNLHEINIPNLQMLRGGIDNITKTAGAVHHIIAESHILTGTTPLRLNFRNSFDTLVNIKRVASPLMTLSSSDPFLLDSADPYQLCASKTVAVVNEDYIASVDHAGYTCIARTSESRLVSGEEVLISYDYTIQGNYLLTTGGLYTPSSRTIRLTNIDSNGLRYRLIIYNSMIQDGLTFKFPSDNKGDFLNTPFEFKGLPDLSRTAGDQLYSIYDEQSA